MKTLARLSLLFTVVITGCTPAPSPQQSASRSSVSAELAAPSPQKQLGINLSSVVDWSSEWPFVDVFKTSRPWMEAGPAPFTYDDHGNPLLRPSQMVSTLIFRDVSGHYPKGRYVATFQGTGEVDINRGDVVETLAKQPGRIEVKVYPEQQGITVTVTESSPRDPIRNIQLWPPGFNDKSSLFHPTFLQRLEPFSVVRFMDWQHTNASPVTTWSQRSKPDDARWSTDAGVPIEVMCDLCNRAHVHPWFCIPHAVDDDYVRNFAKLVKERLDPHLTVYIEYSNEVWNWGFAQTAYAAERGRQLRMGAPDHLRFYARRSTEIFDIFSSTFEPGRLVRVLSGQFVNPTDCETILKHANAYRKADAFAVGAYFGYEFGDPKHTEASKSLSPSALIDKLAQEIDGKNRDMIRRQVQLARKYNLRLLAYEGGQHLVGYGGAENNYALMELSINTNREPRMADLYKKQLQSWFEEGGDLFVAFASCGLPGKFGSWGLLEYQDQPVEQAPKYRAVREFSEQLSESPK